MLGLKEKRRMVRNPYFNQQYSYPYHYHPQQTYGMPPHTAPMNYYPNYPQNQMFYVPYPNQKSPVWNAGPTGVQAILGQFKKKDGGYDLNKVMNTAGQMVHTVNQLSGLVKQVGALFKTKV